MKLSKLIKILEGDAWRSPDADPDVQFVGMKWQDEHHPSATLWPIEFVDAKTDKRTVTVKFITTKP